MRLQWLCTAWLILCFTLAPIGRTLAQVTPQRLPTLNRAVTDLAQVLSAERKEELARKLIAHQEKTGVQLAVVVLDTTSGEPIEDYALRLASHWRGGGEGRDNGALFVLAVSDRRMRLEVGYGLEGRIPDAVAKRIIGAAIPHLKSQDYDAAVSAVVDAFIARGSDSSVEQGQQLAPARAKKKDDSPFDIAKAIPIYGLIFLFGTVIGRIVRGRAERAETEAAADGAPGRPIGHYISRPTQLWLALFVAVAGVGAGLFGAGWFHFGAAVVGLIAGWMFMWSFDTGAFVSIHYLFMVSGFALVPAAVVTAFSGELYLGMVASLIGQLLVTLMYAGGQSRRGTSEVLSSSGVRDSSSSSQWAIPPSGSSSFGSSSSSFGFGSSSSSSFGSSSSSFGSNSSSFGSSSSSSSSSSDYSGGGGSFGGGGASSSW